MQEFLSILLLLQNNIYPIQDTRDIIFETLKNHKTSAIIDVNKTIDFKSDAVLIIDQSTNQIYFEKYLMKKLPIASLTKLMSVIVTIENLSLDEIITVPYRNNIPDGDVITIPQGTSFTVRQLIEMALISSNNDAIYAIADHIGYENFVAMMNKKAKEYEMYQTHFSNPIGYDDTQNYSTTIDMYILAKKSIENKLISNIINTPYYSIYSKQGVFYKSDNTNKLLQDPILKDFVYGIKTGTTQDAKECLIFLYKKNNHKIIGILLGSTDRYNDAKTALYWLHNNI